MDNNQQVIIEQLNKELKESKAKNAILEREKNKYGLNFKKYPETGEAELLHAEQTPYLTLRPEHSTVKDSSQRGDHVLIEGDNLSALVALQASHKGKIDVIYIDPPYNTGNKDFVYNDSFVSNDDGFRHSKWLSFMERRLVLAKELLSETGVVFVSIDDNEQAPLKMLMDSIFGEQNFISNLSWSKGALGKNDSKYIRGSVENILCYKKESLREFTGIPRGGKKYNKKDDKGDYYINNLDAAGLRYSPSLDYPIEAPDGSFIYAGGSKEDHDKRKEGDHGKRDWTWRWGKKKFEESRDLVVIKKNSSGKWKVYTKIHASSGGDIKHKDLIEDYSGLAGTNEIKAIFPKQAFSNPKPSHLIKWITFLHPNKSAIVLDFFAGSGTTGHAVAQLNEEDGGNRQCILVTNNFEEDGSPNGIARDVTAKRMEAVLTGKWADGKERDPLPGNLHYYQIEFAPEETDFESSKTWANNKRVLGLTSLKHNAFRSITPPEEDYGTLVSTLEKGQSSLLANENTLYAFWLDDSIMDLSSELVEEFAEEALELGKSLGLRVEFYVPSNDPEYVPDEDFFEDAYNTHTFPIGYINEVSRVVKDLKGKQLLLSVDQNGKEEEEGEEGLPQD